jgi:arginine/lysine/ornithine decarboxylase
VPLLVAGERIGEELLKTAEKLKTRGCSLQGLSDYSAGTILTVS